MVRSMHIAWQSWRPWLLLLGASVGGAGTALVVSVVLPSWAAVLVGAIGAGIAGVFAAEAQRAVAERILAKARIAADRVDGHPSTNGTRVRDAVDPIPFGVHPSIARGRIAGNDDRVPDFVRRDKF